MKRVFNFSLLLVAVLVIGFASCKNNKSEPPKPNPDTTKEENVKYEFLYAGFLEYLNMHGQQMSMYEISFVEEGVLKGKSILKKGKAISVILVVKEASTNVAFRPANNTYTKENGLMLNHGNRIFSDVYDVELDGKMKERGIGFKDDAQLIVGDGGKVTFKATDTKGIKYTISVDNATYANIGKFKNEDFLLVPQDKYANLSVSGNKKLESEVIEDKVKAMYLVTKEETISGDKLMAHFVLYTKKDASVVEEGNYTVGRSLTANTFLTSNGITNKETKSGIMVDGSCLFNTKTEGTKVYFNKILHIASGNVTVTASNPPNKTEGDILFIGKSYFGHNIKFVYTGSLKPSAASSAPMRVLSK